MKKHLVMAMAAASLTSQAQVVLTGTGTYYQDFNSLAATGTGIGWVNNLPTTSMPGWYSNQTTYDADNGASFSSGQYSYGATANPERALGSVALPGALITYGIRLNNASGSTFTGLNLNYVGEQWRSGSTLSDVLDFEYSTNATGLFTGTWTPVASLDFNSPTNTGAGAINGNLPANQSFQSGVMSSLNWTNGTDVWVRWTHVGNASRHGISIDDVHLNAVVPEPVSLIAMGAGCLALVGSRRKRAK